jgi:hypothetical protein
MSNSSPSAIGNLTQYASGAVEEQVTPVPREDRLDTCEMVAAKAVAQGNGVAGLATAKGALASASEPGHDRFDHQARDII